MLRRPQHSIGADEVHVWHVCADELTQPGVLDAIERLLSAAELARMQCFGHERDRALYLLSRGLKRSVLASYLDCQHDCLQFSYNEYGKPVLCEHSLHFNLTHSRGAVALAISGGREVGVDLEERERRVDYLGLARRFFAEAEARHLEGLPDEERAAAFFAIWTLKEAYVKGLGRGLTFPLDAFCFELDVHRLIAFRSLADIAPRDWHFQQFDVGERHCGAVAVRGNGARVELRDWAAAFIDG